MSSILADQYCSAVCGGGGAGLRGLSQWARLWTGGPIKLWRSNFIFNLCYLPSATFNQLVKKCTVMLIIFVSILYDLTPHLSPRFSTVLYFVEKININLRVIRQGWNIRGIIDLHSQTCLLARVHIMISKLVYIHYRGQRLQQLDDPNPKMD